MKARQAIVRIAQVGLILAGLWLLLRWVVNSLGGVIDPLYPVIAIVLFGLSFLVARLA